MNKERLENLSIFELRGLARKIGVFNPTVLKKQDLILAIYDIQTGKTKPHIAKTKQGRPPKSLGVIDNFVNIFLPDDVLNIPTKEEAYYELSRNVDLHSNELTPGPNDTRCVYKGYLELLNNGCGFLRKKISMHFTPTESVYVLAKQLDEFKLRAGDEILCQSVIVDKNRPMVFEKIDQINGIDVDKFDFDRKNFDDMVFNINTKDINFTTSEMKKMQSKLKLQYGDTIFCHYDESSDFKSFVFNLVEKEKNAFDDYIYLSPSSTLKNGEVLKQLKTELFYSEFADEFGVQERISFLAYNRVKRLAEQGRNVCFIIDDLMGLLSIEKGRIHDLAKSKAILSIAKNLDKGSVTIFCSYANLSFSDLGNFMRSTFASIENACLFIEDKTINIEKSYRK